MKFIFVVIACFFSFHLTAQIRNDTLLARKKFLQGQEKFEMAEYEQAISEYKEAQNFYQKYAIHSLSMECEQKIALVNIRRGEIDEALKVIGQCQQLYLPKLTLNSIQEANLYNTLGEAYLNKGRNDLALEYFKKASEMIRIHHKNNKIDYAQALNNIGLVYWNTGNKELSLEHLQQALQIRQSTFGENHQEVAASYNNIGLLYAQNDLPRARDYYSKALAIYQKIYPSTHPKMAVALNNLAIIDRQEKNFDKSIEGLENVQQIWLSINGENHPNSAFTYSNLGQVYLEKGDFLSAVEYQKRALTIYQKIFGAKHPEVANVHNLIGTIYFRQNKFKEALDSYQKALIANVSDFANQDKRSNPSTDKYFSADVLLSSLLLKAQTYEQYHLQKTLKLDDLKFALTTLELCDRLIQKIRALRSNKSDKIALGAVASVVYEDAIRVCFQLAEVALKKGEYFEKAFEFSEKSKSAVLLSTIADSEAKQFANIPAQLTEEERQLKSEITYLEQKLAEGPVQKLEETYRAKLFELNRKYERFIQTLETKYPDYFNLKYNVKVATVQEIRRLLNEQTTLMSYFIGEKGRRLYLFEINANKARYYDLPLKDTFDKYITGLRNAITYKSSSTFVKTARELYRQLFPQNISGQKLVIIPDGRLGVIPFEALLTNKVNSEQINYEQLPYLLRKHSVSYAYSATLYQETLAKTSDNQNRKDEILLTAPVSFGQNKIQDLPSTEEEVQRIKELFVQKQKNAETYTFQQASEDRIKSTVLKKYSFLHFATHGLVNEESPELSYILLSENSKGKSSEDGNLYSGEIYNLELNALLVNLSCCETGLGKITKGEGIIGLSRALLFAGAGNLVVSLWTVADQSTSELMIQFYSLYLNGDTSRNFSEVLQNAKLKLIGGKEYANPYYWAPFILIGN